MMVSKVCLCYLTVIHMAAAFEFQSELPSSFLSFHAPSHSQIRNIVGAKEQQSRLQKMEEVVGKQEERMAQLNESLKEQLSQTQDQVLAKMEAVQLEEKSHLATIEKQLQQLDGRLDAFENMSSELHSFMADDTDLTAPTAPKEKPKVNFTTVQDVGLAFALIMEPVKHHNMDKLCAQLADGGRLIVLDSKSKLDALKTYVARTSGEKSFYVGLRKKGEQHLWSNGEEIDKSFWCHKKSNIRKGVCGSVKIKGPNRICIGAGRCTKGKLICEKPL